MTDKETGIVYRNKYCGLCNNVTIDQLVQWSSQWSCDEGFEGLLNSSKVINGTVLNSYCVPITYKPPKVQQSPQSVPIRPCWLLVPTCPIDPGSNTTHNIMDYKALVANCTQCGVSSHPTNTSDMYRNSNCEQGNGETNSNIRNCEVGDHVWGVNGSAGRITVIVSRDWLQNRLLLTSSVRRGYTIEITQLVCSENYVFNVIVNTCIMQTYLSDDDCIDCQLLNRTEYTFVDSITEQSHKDNMTHSILMLGTDGTVLICECNKVINGFTPFQRLPDSLFGITIVGFLLDIMAGAVLLVTYSIFKELRTFYGKLLMHMSAVVIGGDLAFVLTLPAEIFAAALKEATCEALAILSHYILLLRFASMSILAFEIFKNFYAVLKLKNDSDKRTWRSLLLYILPQYMVPLVIVGICVILNYTVDGVVDYGRHFSGLCWITVPTAILGSFVIPSGIMILFNMFVFIFRLVVTIKIWKSQSKIESYGQKPKQLLWRNFRVLFAIFSTSGVTWIFTIVVFFDRTIDDTTLWFHYIFAIFNTIQLVFVAFAYICTKRVAKLYKGFFTRLYTKSKMCTKRFQTKTNGELPT